MAKCLIFGATGAMGSQIARSLHSRGQAVHLIARQPEPLSSLADSLSASFSVADVTDRRAVDAAIQAGSEDGQIAGLVWAVGSIVLKPLSRLEEEDFLSAFQLNVSAAALAIKSAQPGLTAAKGAVVLFSSVAAAFGFPSHAAIAAAKAGVEGLGRALAAELAPDIRVNVIAPSLSQSKMAAPLISNPAMAQGIAQTHPMGRLGQASDFSALCCLLLDNSQSGWMTGTVLPVDGGRGQLAAPLRAR